LVGEIKKNGGTSGERLGTLWEVDVFLDSKLHSFDNEVCAIRNTDSKIERKEVCGELVAKGMGNMGRDDASDGSGDAQGA